MTRGKVDPDGFRLPIKIDSTSNGEFEPVPISTLNQCANAYALEAADHKAKRLNLTRRAFQTSLMGAASALLSFNRVNAASGRTGGSFDLDDETALDRDAALHALGKRDFILDVHGHFVNPQGDWLKTVPDGERPISGVPQSRCELADNPGDRSYLDCLSSDIFIKEVFVESDTDMMVLTFVPSAADAEPLTIEEADAVRTIVDEMDGTARMLLHGRVNPNQPGDIELMPELAERWGVSAWKCYTHWSPAGGKGFLLTDDIGLAMIEEARRLDVRRICVHKGIVPSRDLLEYSTCEDVGVVAKMYPDVDFLIYHSGFHIPQMEGPFRDGAGTPGIDTLVQSLKNNDVTPNSNVYADLGTTWRFLMRDLNQAAHALGKLFKYVGEDNVLWGTDSIWYGSPQDQIQAFRTFQISEQLREIHGYPEITPALRAKIFGLNGARVYGIDAGEIILRAQSDKISKYRAEYAEIADPHFLTYGPKSRREFLNLLSWNGGRQV